MFIDEKKIKRFFNKKGFQVVPQTIVILIIVILLIGIVSFIIYSKITSKLAPIQ